MDAAAAQVKLRSRAASEPLQRRGRRGGQARGGSGGAGAAPLHRAVAVHCACTGHVARGAAEALPQRVVWRCMASVQITWRGGAVVSLLRRDRGGSHAVARSLSPPPVGETREKRGLLQSAWHSLARCSEIQCISNLRD